jgi:hypothetical protein
LVRVPLTRAQPPEPCALRPGEGRHTGRFFFTNLFFSCSGWFRNSSGFWNGFIYKTAGTDYA